MWCSSFAKIQYMLQWTQNIFEINYVTSTEMSHYGYMNTSFDSHDHVSYCAWIFK